jgi:hypothetical protein
LRAKFALVAGLVAGGIALLAPNAVVGAGALAAMLVMLPAAFAIEFVRRGDSTPASGMKTAAVVGLFGCGVFVFVDSQTLATTAFGATVVLLLVVGFVEGHLRAVWWAALLLASALAADILWWLDWDPFDRSDDGEPIAQFPFVLIGLPIPMALIAAGVGARWFWRQARPT